jgi:hypothetical protein
MAKTVKDVDSRVSQHEAVCAERYQGIMYRMDRMEKGIIAASFVLICGMATIIWNGLGH